MEIITSKDNARVKRLRALVSTRREREDLKMFVAEGLRLCLDAADSGVEIIEAYATAAALSKHPELARLVDRSGECFEISEDAAAKISDTKSPQGVFALCRAKVMVRPQNHAENARYLLLSSLQDPGNVGAIIRAAEAFGLSGICLSVDCPELYSPKVLRATMGGAFRMPVWVAEDMPSEITSLRAQGVRVFAAALRNGALSLGEKRFEGPCAAVLGNEGAGLSAEVIAACDCVFKIPMRGRGDSLGVAMAAGIISWEMTR